ncbi:MAG: hypothetical protein HN548_07690 [Opitutae bacterium]|jgi:hypothetical protein|nr:hypothetical protein [Opitutae bacterium]
MELRPKSNETVPPAVSLGMPPQAFYVTGAGGRLTNGLGLALIDLKIPYSGMEISKYVLPRDRLGKLSSLMSEFIKRGGSKVIAVSAGAFLFLKHIETYHNPDLQVTFFSPVLVATEAFVFNSSMVGSLRIVLGSEDPVCPLHVAEAFNDSFEGSTLRVVEKAGHNLPHEVVREEIMCLMNS